MKVVLFCGGLGTRLREYSETVPKPMVTIGYRPMLWHVMKYYAHWGHNDFILCLGYRGDVVKQYFLDYEECLSNDFVLSRGGEDIRLFSSDIVDWKVTFVDTGLHSNVGQRLLRVRQYLEGERTFLANYSDGLSDLALPVYLEQVARQDKVGSFLCVKPNLTFHSVSLGEEGLVNDIRHVAQTNLLINGGFFAFKQEIFDYIREGEELVQEPFQRLIGKSELFGYRYDGFWACMDTFKDKQAFDNMEARGDTPWQVWRSSGERSRHAA
jgi:glucose-1-phosphate cytidylyltransferase